MTFIELGSVTMFLSVSSLFAFNSFNNIYKKLESFRVKNEIIMLIRNIDRNKKINFILDKNIIECDGQKIHLDNKFLYKTNNKNFNFTRSLNNNGNLDKGFSIQIIGKKDKKIYQEIIVNSANPLKIPLLKSK